VSVNAGRIYFQEEVGSDKVFFLGVMQKPEGFKVDMDLHPFLFSSLGGDTGFMYLDPALNDPSIRERATGMGAEGILTDCQFWKVGTTSVFKLPEKLRELILTVKRFIITE